MSIEPGQTLLHYRIVEKLGEGGMGVVWKALDTTLGREVAIKALPEVFAGDADRLSRFEREARLLASLNHPAIAGVYGLHVVDAPNAPGRQLRFLAMELVPGENLAERLARGPLPVDEAIEVARQIAEALEAAHENGVVHRDLKPANVVLRPDGGIKVLDFGLAKALLPEPGSGEASPSMSPTMTSAPTAAGMILGTAAYMSPEQARGKAVDRRADIWALGCTLYEMLSARRLFDGETVSDTLAAVLRAEVDLSALPEGTPRAVRRLLARCLDRDPHTRLRDVGEARILLAAPRVEAEDAASRDGVAASGWWGRGWIAATAAIALVAGLALGRYLLAPNAAPPAQDFAFNVAVADKKVETGSIALSPDGKLLALLVRGENGEPELWVRPLDSVEARPLPSTRGASFPFWSPDGHEIGFFAHGQLLRIALDGTAARPIAAVVDPRGGSWSRDGVILFGSASGPIRRVSASGGAEPVAVTEVEHGVEDAHVWPVFLPDGKRFVFLSDAGSDEGHRVWLASLDGAAPRILLKVIRSSLALDPAGALLLAHQNQLVAYPFDLQAGVLSGDPVLVADGVVPLGTHHHAPFTVSGNGILAYQQGASSADLVLLDFEGRVRTRIGEPQRFANAVISPDGRRVAYELHESTDETLVWVHDIERGVRTPVSPRQARADSAAWSADGETVFFDANPTGKWEVYRQRANGGGEPESLGTPAEVEVGVMSCSPDGRWLLVGGTHQGGNWDLYLYPLDVDDPQWRTWVDTPAAESFGAFSPDSRWLAYASDASGRMEVYVAAVEGGPTAQRWQISSNGGREPRFSPDGRRIYYRSAAGQLMSVAIEVERGRLRAAAPEALFELSTPDVIYERNTFDLTPDGEGLLVVQAIGDADSAIRVRTDWRSVLN